MTLVTMKLFALPLTSLAPAGSAGGVVAAVFSAAAEKSAAPTPPADPAGASEVSGSANSFIVTSVIEPVFYGKLSPEEAVALLRQQANAILGKNKK